MDFKNCIEKLIEAFRDDYESNIDQIDSSIGYIYLCTCSCDKAYIGMSKRLDRKFLVNIIEGVSID